MKKEDQLVRQPMYQQLSEILRNLIRSKEYEQGDQFLTERQIVEQYRVSRPTANKVLSSMVVEGALEFRKGVGTFVLGPRLDYDIRFLVSFTQKAKQAGRKPTTRVLEFERRKAAEIEARIAKRLNVSAGEDVYILGRLRLADNVPVILERRWVPAALCPGLTRKEIRGSIYELWTTKYGLKITEADQTIRAVRLLGRDAKLLDTKPGSAGFQVSAVGYAGSRPLWWEETVYRGDSYEFHHHRPAPGRLIAVPGANSSGLRGRHQK
jgi:GntR family transcriptional regulator